MKHPTHGQSATELKTQIEIERQGAPFVVYRDAGSSQRVLVLSEDRVTIGRDPSNGLALTDDQVSRVHAELVRLGVDWVISDQGLSTNGTFVNGDRLRDRKRLEDRDLIEIGATGILFRQPSTASRPGPTVASDSTEARLALTASQRRILVALCRPFASGESFVTPATNREIADELHLSVDAVKGHLRVLFERFDLGELAQNEKRARLAERALRSGAVKPRDLG